VNACVCLDLSDSKPNKKIEGGEGEGLRGILIKSYKID
jgi:hypothetical protein